MSPPNGYIFYNYMQSSHCPINDQPTLLLLQLQKQQLLFLSILSRMMCVQWRHQFFGKDTVHDNVIGFGYGTALDTVVSVELFWVNRSVTAASSLPVLNLQTFPSSACSIDLMESL